MELTVTSVDYCPAELTEQVPFRIRLLRVIPGRDRPDYWLGELVQPLRWIDGGREKRVDHVVICARWRGTRIASRVHDLPIGIAYVTDPSQLTDATVDFDKCRYVAIGAADGSGGRSMLVAAARAVAGRIGQALGFGGRRQGAAVTMGHVQIDPKNEMRAGSS